MQRVSSLIFLVFRARSEERQSPHRGEKKGQVRTENISQLSPANIANDGSYLVGRNNWESFHISRSE